MGTLLAVFMICGTWPVRLQAAPSAPEVQTDAPLRDGSHDFDFDIGTWHTHIRRILILYQDPRARLSSMER